MSIIGGINLGNLTDYLFLFADGSVDANWQGASKGYVGDVAVDGIKAKERTSGYVPYAGTIYTNDATLGAWQNIVDQNPGQAFGSVNQVARIASLEADLVSAFHQINALPPTPGFESVNSAALNGLNTQNGINEVFVINVTSGLNFSDKIYITGDPGDVYILRWDTDGDPTNGYQGQVKPQSGGAIVPQGGLTPANFINVAGDINSSGGGTNPLPPYPQGPRFDNGQGALINGGADFNGGGFFTGYWLTTGSPTLYNPVTGLYYGETSSLSNGIFVGGWYTITTKFSMTSGTSGVYVSPNPATEENPAIQVIKYVSNDNGVIWFDANTPPGPTVVPGSPPRFRFVVTNIGNVPLTNVQVTDNVYGPIGTVASLAPGASSQFVITRAWAPGQQVNVATAAGQYQGRIVTDSDPAYWFGVEEPTASIDVEKEVSPDNGATWFDADTAPGPDVPVGTNPHFRFTVTNTGNITLTNVELTDNVYGPIGMIDTLAPGASDQFIIIGSWALGQHKNIVTATGHYDGNTVTDSDPAFWVGVEPSIDLEKEVSPDNGATWFDADTPPGPAIPPGTNPLYRFTVTNTGPVPLENVQVNDNVLGFIGTVASLAPGAFAQFIKEGVWAFGQQENTATATGDFDGVTVTDTDLAHYVGTANPAIDVEKQISVDGGFTWQDADAPPFPVLVGPQVPMYRFIVTNTGNVTLTQVSLNDTTFGQITVGGTLAPGASFTAERTGVFALGEHCNTATATGAYVTEIGVIGVEDTDSACYVGTENPAIDIEKYVSVDNGVTWIDADTPPGPLLPAGVTPQFRFVVTNIGNVTLTDITVTDDVFGLIGTLPSLAPGASFEWIIIG